MGIPGKRTLTQDLAPVVRTAPKTEASPNGALPATSSAGPGGASGTSDADEAQILEHQARLKNTDVEIPALQGALLTTRIEAVKRGLLSQSAFEASLDLSLAVTQLEPAATAGAPVDVGAQVIATNAAQRLYLALQRDTAGGKNFRAEADPPSELAGTSMTARNPYTGDCEIIHVGGTKRFDGPLKQLPMLIHAGNWELAFPAYRELMNGLDRWVADQLRTQGKGADAARGDGHEHQAQLLTGLERIAGKHATRIPAVFRPAPKNVESDKAAGRPTVDSVPMNVYFWKDAHDGKIHLYDLTTPSQPPHEQTIDGTLTAAHMNTFFEEVARYPEGEVHYTIPGGGAGIAPTSGKTKWYEWLGYAGLAVAGVGLALVTAGASIPATWCFAAGALAGGVSAAGHLVDSVHLGTSTTATVVLDVAQIAASFASAGAMNLTVKAGSAVAALANSRYFLPLVTVDAVANTVQVVALTDVTFAALSKTQQGPGSDDDKQRAIAVLLTQLIVTGGLAVLSVQGARNVRAMARKPLELVDQNGTKVLRLVGDTAPEATAHPNTLAGDTAAGAEHQHAPHDSSTRAGNQTVTPELAAQSGGILTIPQGVSEAQFDQAKQLLKSEAGHIGHDMFVHGSRASGAAKPTSDIDFGIRVDSTRFDALIKQRFGTPNPGSAKLRTMQHAMTTGKIQAGEAGLRGLRTKLEAILGIEVDISVIRAGGPFDQGPFIPLP